MSGHLNLIGKVFTRLTVISETPRRQSGAVLWVCLCICGKRVVASTNSLRSNNTRSCGCLRRRVNLTLPKQCTKCKLVKPPDSFHNFKVKNSSSVYKRSYCKSCENENQKKYRKTSGKSREYHLKKFNLSPQEFNDLLTSQSNSCKICGITKNRNFANRNLSIDHCHKTGRIRGLLCNSCNSGLGYFQDNPELLIKASQYLKGGV